MSVNDLSKAKKQIEEMQQSLDANRKFSDQLRHTIADIDIALARSRRFLKKMKDGKPYQS
ncbi:MAG: hypothetical protein JWQ71_1042 [Pedosphaera sp.]|nr:hypothetical protein [Pedosphaera sp.]